MLFLIFAALFATFSLASPPTKSDDMNTIKSSGESNGASNRGIEKSTGESTAKSTKSTGKSTGKSTKSTGKSTGKSSSQKVTLTSQKVAKAAENQLKVEPIFNSVQEVKDAMAQPWEHIPAKDLPDIPFEDIAHYFSRNRKVEKALLRMHKNAQKAFTAESLDASHQAAGHAVEAAPIVNHQRKYPPVPDMTFIQHENPFDRPDPVDEIIRARPGVVYHAEHPVFRIDAVQATNPFHLLNNPDLAQPTGQQHVLNQLAQDPATPHFVTIATSDHHPPPSAPPPSALDYRRTLARPFRNSAFNPPIVHHMDESLLRDRSNSVAAPPSPNPYDQALAVPKRDPIFQPPIVHHLDESLLRDRSASSSLDSFGTDDELFKMAKEGSGKKRAAANELMQEIPKRVSESSSALVKEGGQGSSLTSRLQGSSLTSRLTGGQIDEIMSLIKKAVEFSPKK